MNRVSFLLISIGYILSIFNTYTVKNPWKLLFALIIVTSLICIISTCICKSVAKKNAHKYVDVKVEKLPKGTTYYEIYGETK